MVILIFIYILGIVLTSLLIRYLNDKDLNDFFENNESSLNGALMFWPVFLIFYGFLTCRRLTKIK